MSYAYSKFYFGFEIDDENFNIDFDEGAGELTAEIEVGSYTPEELCAAVASAMSAVGANTYEVAFDRATRIFTISADSDFDILTNSGSHAGSTPYSILGFSTTADFTGEDEYDGDGVGGSSYTPPFPIQSYTPPENWVEAVDSSINESSSGEIEAISFGERQFTKFNITNVSNITHGSQIIRESSSNVANLRTFLEYCRTKGKLQFMPDEAVPATYYTIILETTENSSKGTGTEVKEQFGVGLPGFFETGVLKWRVVEESV